MKKQQIYSNIFLFLTGYGNVVPLSDTGKIITMFYAVPGIAVTMTTYSYIGKIFTNLTRLLIIYVEMKLLKRKSVLNINGKMLVCYVCMVPCIILTQSAITNMEITENYRYLDSIYFNFVTLTTIGFGDYDFKMEKYIGQPHLFVLMATLTACGMALIASIISSISAVLTVDKFKKHSRQSRSRNVGRRERLESEQTTM